MEKAHTEQEDPCEFAPVLGETQEQPRQQKTQRSSVDRSVVVLRL